MFLAGLIHNQLYICAIYQQIFLCFDHFPPFTNLIG